jgi:hypothetical protein
MMSEIDAIVAPSSSRGRLPRRVLGSMFGLVTAACTLALRRPSAAADDGPRKVRPLVTRGLIVLSGLVAAVGLFATGARADVNTTTNGYGWATMSNCTVYVGDEASPYRYAIGDTTVRCGSHHSIWVYTELYRNGALIAHSTRPYTYYRNATYVHDVPTTAIHCGGKANWYTVSYVIIDRGAWQGWRGPTESFTPSC